MVSPGNLHLQQLSQRCYGHYFLKTAFQSILQNESKDLEVYTFKGIP